MLDNKINIECPECGHNFLFNVDEEIRKQANQDAEQKYKDELNQSNKQIGELTKRNEEDIDKAKNEAEQKYKDYIDKTKNELAQRKKEIEEITKRNEEDIDKAKKEISSKLEMEYIEKQAVLIKNAKESGVNEEKLKIDTERSQDKSLIESLIKQVNDLKATANQSSNKRQGDSLESELVRILKNLYPLDVIEPNINGQSGADCLQIVCDKSGKEISRILWEAKETKKFNDKIWIPKLKIDQKNANATFSVILTKTLPDEISDFGVIDNVFITDINSISGISYILREFSFILSKKDVFDDNNGEIMAKIYEYILSLKYDENFDIINKNNDFISNETVLIDSYIKGKMNKIREKSMGIKNIVFEIKNDINEIINENEE